MADRKKIVLQKTVYAIHPKRSTQFTFFINLLLGRGKFHIFAPKLTELITKMEKYEPKVSIVTVVYNDVKHIEGTILSVTRQNYPNIEYIVIDGGSTDGTVEVIKKYADKIAYWVSEPDKGIYDAMNKGIAVATGEWILFRNCGDYFSSLSDVSKVFNGESYEGADVLCGKCLYWDNEFYSIKVSRLTPYKKKQMAIYHPATFVRTTLQKAMPFDLKYKILADYDFFHKCYLSGKVFKYVPYVLAIFDATEGASSVNPRQCRIERYYINGGKNDAIGKVKLFIRVSQLITKTTLRRYVPKSIIKKRKLSQGKKMWPNGISIEDLINQALNNENPDIIHILVPTK